MRIGHNYQAEIPQFIAYAPAPEYYEDEKAIRVWSPHNKIPEHIIDEFIVKAKDKFSYNMEQALGMLSWHKFDLNRAYADLANFVPYPNEWSVEDKVLFEQAYQFHEKQFNKIKQMLPDKPMASLINYYYMWKKTRTRASLMERQTRRFAASKKNADSNENSDEESAEDEGAEEESAAKSEVAGADKEETGEQACSCCAGVEDPHVVCCLCQSVLRDHGKNNEVIIDAIFDCFCENCYVSWKASGGKISTNLETGDCFYTPSGDTGPRQILFTYSDVVNLIEGPPEQGDLMLKVLESRIQDRRRDIQSKKQTLSQINEKIQPIADQIADLNMDEFKDILPEYKPVKEWTTAEAQLVVQGIRRYGTDFSAISDVVRTKSPQQITLFWSTQAERLGLKVLVDEYERTAGSSTKPIEPRTDKEQVVSSDQERQET